MRMTSKFCSCSCLLFKTFIDGFTKVFLVALGYSLEPIMIIVGSPAAEIHEDSATDNSLETVVATL